MNDSISAIQESYTRIKLLSSDIQIKDQTIAILQERLQEVEDQTIQFQKAKDYAEKQFGLLQEEHDAMFDNSQKKIKQLQQFNQQLLVTLKESQDKNQELLEKNKFLTQELNLKHQTQLEIQDQVLLIKDSVKGLESELNNTQKKYNQCKRERSEFENQIKSLLLEKSNKDSSLNGIMKQMEGENELLKGELEDYRNRLDAQHKELVELKYIKIQYEDIEKKFEQLNEQYNIQVQNSMEQERNYMQQFEDMNQSNLKLQTSLTESQTELFSLKEYNNQLENQLQDYNKLFIFIQSQINETIEDVLTVKSKKITVYERLYESRKSSSSQAQRKSVGKKKKKNQFNIQQIEEFFNDIKEIVQALINTNNQLKEENEQLNKNFQDMHKVGEQLRYKIDQLNQEHLKTKDIIKREHQLQVEQYDDRIIQLQDIIQQLNDRAQQEGEQYEQNSQQLEEMETQVIEKNKMIQQLQQGKIEQDQEFNELKKLFDLQQADLEEAIVRRAINQNKIALCYGFITFTIKNVKTSQRQVIQQLNLIGNYIHYYFLIRQQFQKKNYKIYLKFRKIVYAIIFVKYLVRYRQQLYSRITISLEHNDMIDDLFEQYIPQLHSEDGNAQDIIVTLYKQIQKQLMQYDYKTISKNISQAQYSRIIQFGKEDQIKYNTLYGQIDYYQQQLQLLQQRVYQLDNYITQLESEIQDREQQQNHTPIEQSIKQFNTDQSPPKSQSIAQSMHNELASILSKRTASKPGSIVKQTL
ncbi:hypothetical protein pb186bvf_007862 [Paramecium bursaria]